MSIESNGRTLQFHLAAPDGGAPLRIKDGDTVVWEGQIGTKLHIEFDLETWQVPEPLRQLLGISLPPLSQYSLNAFTPLATSWLGLATLTYDRKAGTGFWSERAVLPGQMLPISVMAGSLHYAQAVFEGQKIFFTTDGDTVSARTFRATRNAERMWRSALRMGIPVDSTTLDDAPLDLDGFVALYQDLVQSTVEANARAGLFEGEFAPHDITNPDFNWHSTPPALYVRPILFATGAVLGVKPAEHYTLAMYVTPVGKYRSDMVLRVERTHPRAVKGGTGAVKASCNYAPTLTMMQALTENRDSATADQPWESVFDDILFIGPGEFIEEMGGANFFVLADEGGELVLRTPRSVQETEEADTILPGVTRDTVLEIARSLGVNVQIDEISLARLMELSDDEARRVAVFTSGTAAGIAPVVALLDGGRVQHFAVWDDVDDPARHRHLTADPAAPGSALAMGKLIRTLLFRSQLGDLEGIRRLAGDRANDLLRKLEGWVESFPI
jgi:branched-chain amino acid aminotransferase